MASQLRVRHADRRVCAHTVGKTPCEEERRHQREGEHPFSPREIGSCRAATSQSENILFELSL